MASYKKRAQFYRSLGTLYQAGVPLLRALTNPFPSPFGRTAVNISLELEANGGQLAESMAARRKLFSAFECSLVRVGEKTGRLDVVFEALAEWCSFRHRMRGILISGLAYPAFLYHAAAILLPFIGMLTAKRCLSDMAMRMLFWNLIPYVLFFAVRTTGRVVAGTHFSSSAVLKVPLLGRLVEKAEMAQFFRAYAMGLASGVMAPEAVALAAGGCRNGVIRRAMLAAASESERSNRPPGEILSAFLPGGLRRHPTAIQLLNTGEESGRADQMADHIAALYADETERAFELLMTILPKAVYLCIVVAVAWQVIQAYMTMYGAVFKELDL